KWENCWSGWRPITWPTGRITFILHWPVTLKTGGKKQRRKTRPLFRQGCGESNALTGNMEKAGNCFFIVKGKGFFAQPRDVGPAGNENGEPWWNSTGSCWGNRTPPSGPYHPA